MCCHTTTDVLSTTRVPRQGRLAPAVLPATLTEDTTDSLCLLSSSAVLWVNAAGDALAH